MVDALMNQRGEPEAEASKKTGTKIESLISLKEKFKDTELLISIEVRGLHVRSDVFKEFQKELIHLLTEYYEFSSIDLDWKHNFVGLGL